MIFAPRFGARTAPDEVRQVGLADGSRLDAVFLPNPDARFTLWYFHGNAESLADIGPRLHELRDLGFSVFAVEYPGYGRSFERPTESRIYESLEAGIGYLGTELNIRPENLVIYGRSVGGGPAVELASREDVAGLILESTFVSAYRVMTRWPILLGDKFNNLRKLPRVSCPLLVIHGRSDRLIPFSHSELLYEKAPTRQKQHLWVKFAGHNDLRRWAGESYRRAILDFLSVCGSGTTDA
jgi:fermentation-respiration switch protein FrsA (DUF1100 family)